MDLRTALGISGVLLICVCGPVSAYVQQLMVDRVNEKLPKVDRFDSVGWYFSKNGRLQNAYKSLYPDGKLSVKLRLLFVLSASGLLLAAWGFRGF